MLYRMHDSVTTKIAPSALSVLLTEEFLYVDSAEHWRLTSMVIPITE